MPVALQAFGLSDRADRLYRELLRAPDTADAELAAIVGLNCEQLAASRAELTELGLLRPSWDDPALLRPVVPELGLAALLARREAELLAHRQQFEQARAVYGQLRAEAEADRRHTRGESLLDADAIRDRLAELGAAATSQVLALVPNSSPYGDPGSDGPSSAGPSNRAPGNGAPTDPLGLPVEELLLRGVELRVLFVDAVRNRPQMVEYARRVVGLGGQVRTVGSLPLRMVVLDREDAVLPLDPERADTATVLHGRGPVAALCALFDGLWQGAAPLCHPRGRDRNGMTAQHYALLRILQRGDTDVVAARKLGVSERTVRRLTAEALEVLGARSRFQAGARAAERGWLH
ncbi:MULTISPECIES: LuxR family transcriptional regulator [Kitasatospora]|uniref:Putative LuxR family transcriptional regulator n=1 Tax=Kitasatospora setae (strain ATCC 33774 / DSM 43861 / JCM 3304 / KCC A-0304 / NBRC 14216 / KM-6054) TaxID=452652 RepID=E4N3S0_KITSK|nr:MULTISPECIES: LuxR family transcriptional regulator [Kitasatospora]BAJ31551.1 putative LuxR family transcriptional regulator [Kitasatospora setae KM-6054]